MKINHNNKHYRKNERGNVLFLILIAVALFAALSYAVTSSTRSGGGDASEETNLISSSQVTQYPSSVRTAIVRQIISQNVDATNLEFNPPSDFSNLTDVSGTGGTTKKSYGVFHPDGGGAIYATSPPEVMNNNSAGTWTFNAEFEIENIRTTATNGDGNEIIAFLANVKPAICRKINDELGINDSTLAVTTIIVGSDLSGTSAGDYGINMDHSYSFPTTDFNIGASNQADGLSGQPYGCFINGTADSSYDSDYVYYHVLVER